MSSTICFARRQASGGPEMVARRMVAPGMSVSKAHKEDDRSVYNSNNQEGFLKTTQQPTCTILKLHPHSTGVFYTHKTLSSASNHKTHKRHGNLKLQNKEGESNHLLRLALGMYNTLPCITAIVSSISRGRSPVHPRAWYKTKNAH